LSHFNYKNCKTAKIHLLCRISYSFFPKFLLAKCKLPDAITFISDANIVAFYKQRAVACDSNDDELNKTLRGLGINYIVDEIKEFDSMPNKAVITGEGLQLQRYTKNDVSYAHPLGLPFAENKANLYVYPNNLNVVHVGKSYSSDSYDGVWDRPSEFGIPEGAIGKHTIHDHPNSAFNLYGKVLGLADAGKPGPSGNGMGHGDRKTERYLPYYNLVVENGIVYFYGYDVKRYYDNLHNEIPAMRKTTETIIPIPLEIFSK